MTKQNRECKFIVIHCTAGFGSVDSIKKYWRESLNWLNYGYHIIVDLEGKLHFLASFDKVVNGVKGYNSVSINISYIGGVNKDDYTVSEDTRTPAQKKGLIEAIKIAREYAPKAKIQGHRDFSPDKNKNGIIDTWERIKECPSIDAIKEYKGL